MCMCAACAPLPRHCTGRAVPVRRRYAAWLDLVDDLGLVEIGLGVATGLGGVFKGQFHGQFTRRKAPLCSELTYYSPPTTYHLPLSTYYLGDAVLRVEPHARHRRGAAAKPTARHTPRL